MKKLLIYTLFIAFIAQTSRAGDIVEIKYSTITEERNIKDFKSIAVSGNFNVFVKIGNVEKIKIEGDPSAISNLKTVVENQSLIIKPKDQKFWNKNFSGTKLNIFVTAKSINSLVLNGSGLIRVDDNINTQNFTTALNGSGNIELRGTFKNFSGAINGSGKIKCSGKVDSANFSISGSGVFFGSDFSTESSSASISGSGNINVKVNKTLKSVINGSGKIYYAGNPKVTSVNSGSGKVIQKN